MNVRVWFTALIVFCLAGLVFNLVCLATGGGLIFVMSGIVCLFCAGLNLFMLREYA